MNSDPSAFILAAGILGAALGFLGCALMVSHRIREAEEDAYWEGYAACNREAHADDDEIEDMESYLADGRWAPTSAQS